MVDAAERARIVDRLAAAMQRDRIGRFARAVCERSPRPPRRLSRGDIAALILTPKSTMHAVGVVLPLAIAALFFAIFPLRDVPWFVALPVALIPVVMAVGLAAHWIELHRTLRDGELEECEIRALRWEFGAPSGYEGAGAFQAAHVEFSLRGEAVSYRLSYRWAEHLCPGFRLLALSQPARPPLFLGARP